MQSPYSVAAASSSSSSSSVVPDLTQYTKEQLYFHIREAELRAAQAAQQLQQQQLQAQLSAAAPAVAPQDTAAQAEVLARALAANATIILPLFDGSGSVGGTAAHSWLRQVERAFDERASIAGPVSDGRRIGAAGVALRGGADTWYASLTQRPSTWGEFKKALLGRFQPTSVQLILENRLNELVDAAAKLRHRLNTQGLERYTQQFQLLAHQIPSGLMLERTKVLLYAKGLPNRLHEHILHADVKAQESGVPMDLSQIVDQILQRSATRESALGHTTAAAGQSSSSDAMDLSAVQQCCQAFGVSAADAAQYMEPAEGWSLHDTSAPLRNNVRDHAPSTPSSSASAFAQQLNAIQQQLSAMSSGSSSRRSIAPPARESVPKELVAERVKAGLCVRCGVAKYEGGNTGHNSRTCKAPMDKTTSAAVGAKKAGGQLFQ